jgi:hypothetical protein
MSIILAGRFSESSARTLESLVLKELPDLARSLLLLNTLEFLPSSFPAVAFVLEVAQLCAQTLFHVGEVLHRYETRHSHIHQQVDDESRVFLQLLN